MSYDVHMIKPQVMPFELPWMVSPSTPFLRLVTCENASQEPTYVEFAITHLRELSECESEGVSIEIVAPPLAPAPDSAGDGAPENVARVVFGNAVAARMYPAF